MKRWLCLVLAIVLMLAGCQQDQGPAPSGNTSPEETEPSSDPASDWSQGSWEEAVAHYHQYRESAARSEEEMFSGGLPHPPVPGTAPAPDPEGGEPVRVVMQVQEYHSGKDGAGNEDTCQVEIPRLEGELDQVRELLDQMEDIRAQAVRLEGEEAGLLRERERLAQLAPAALEQPVEERHLARVIELWTKIPASQIQEQEYERLAKLEDRLKEHIIGQDEAVSAVAAAVLLWEGWR